MNDEINILIRNADQTQKAEISVSRFALCREILEEAQDNWSLPKDENYKLVSVTASKELRLEKTLADEDVQEGDLLHVQPILVAGKQ